MSLILRWVGEADYEAVAEARAQSYGSSGKELGKFREGVVSDKRIQSGDILLAEQDGKPVGTTTAVPLTMWVRGTAMSCQGVAFVGTVLTARRAVGDPHPAGALAGSAGGASASPARGVASQLMAETLRKAREHGDVISALMPFRASFYEHFGYGLVERRNDWTIPLSILPHGPFSGFRLFEPADLPALERCKHRIARQGQCDLERPLGIWDWWLKRSDGAWMVVDPSPAGGTVAEAPEIRSWLTFTRVHDAGKDFARISDMGFDSPESFVRQLHYLSSLKDQYHSVTLTLPVDLQLNRLLREPQVPHRPVNHAVASVTQYTRMQLRILDHKRFLEGLVLPQWVKHVTGEAHVIVRESEGNVANLRLRVEAGKIFVMAGPSAGSIEKASTGAFECADHVWASVACGDLSPQEAAKLGLAGRPSPAALSVLEVLSAGPAPFTYEYF